MDDDIAQDNEPLRSEKGVVCMGGGHWERLHEGWGQKQSRIWLQTSHPSRALPPSGKGSHLGSCLSHTPLPPKQMRGDVGDWR